MICYGLRGGIRPKLSLLSGDLGASAEWTLVFHIVSADWLIVLIWIIRMAVVWY